MSFQYLNQFKSQYNKNGRLNDLIVDNNITTNDLQINQYTFNKVLLINQLTNSTTLVDANYKNHLRIVTQSFSTPHSNNNSTSFIITNIYTQSTGSYPNLNVNIQDYEGSQGLPIVTGKILSSNRYEVTIINLHKNEDLNGAFVITVDLTYLIT